MSTNEVKITYGNASNEFMDGFAEGYSRAWQECWDYMHSKITEENKAQEDLRRRENEPAPLTAQEEKE